MLRILFGFFPTYRDSPLRPPAPRVLQIGDASGVQSPLSFGGFGAMTRHLARLTTSVHEALQVPSSAAAALDGCPPAHTVHHQEPTCTTRASSRCACPLSR